MKQSAKHVMKNLSANCPELFQGYSKLVVPYVFLETCQQGASSILYNSSQTKLSFQLFVEMKPPRFDVRSGVISGMKSYLVGFLN